MTHEHNIVDADQRFTIDATGKNITNPPGNKSVVVQYDHNSEVFAFQIPRFIEGHDMTKTDLVQIHYVNTSTGTSVSTRISNAGIYKVLDLSVDPEDENLATFTWTLSDEGTRFAGTIEFQIKFICYGDEPGVPNYKWQTKIFSAIKVEEGIENAEIVVEENPDVIVQFEERISALESGGVSITEDKLSDELAQKINSKADGTLFLKRSSTQLIKLADTDTTINGLHIVVHNNHISLSGTATAGVYRDMVIDEGILKFEANANYAISFQNIKGDSASPYDGIFVWIGEDGNKAVPIPNKDARSVINTPMAKDIHLRWNLSAGDYNKEFDFKIEYGTAFTPFEPYYVVDSVANGSITKEKLSEDVQSGLNAVSDLPSAELFGKSMYSDGDSIADGSVTNKISYAHLIADKYGMNLTSKAVGNTTIAVRDGQVSSIVGRVLNMTGEYDYILLNGGTNDVTYNVPLGEIAEGTNVTFNGETRKTTLGALEEICQFLNANYCSAKKLFIFVNARVDGKFTKTKETNSKMKQVLNKYGIPYIDISEITSLGIWNDEIKSEYFVDSIHPNAKAYEEFYVPYIEKALLFGGYIGSGG